MQILHGGVAQLGERLACTEEVTGSSPVISTREHGVLFFENWIRQRVIKKLLRVYGGCLGAESR